MACGKGVLVLLLGTLLLDHDAAQTPPAELDIEFEQDCVERQRKGVDRLDRDRLVVAIGLADGDLAE